VCRYVLARTLCSAVREVELSEAQTKLASQLEDSSQTIRIEMRITMNCVVLLIVAFLPCLAVGSMVCAAHTPHSNAVIHHHV
jgi:hypothetical protein